jgi:hypothetical protein
MKGLGMQDAGGEGAAGAGPILDDDRLAEVPRRNFAEAAHLGIGGAAGGPGDDQPDRSFRKSGGAGGAGQQGRGGQGNEPQQAAPDGALDGWHVRLSLGPPGLAWGACTGG